MIRLALVIAAGAALRFAFLGGDGLWLDEGYTAWTVDLPAAEHRAAMIYDDAPPLYYSVEGAIVPHLPRNEASLRLLSGVCGVAGIAALAAWPPSAIALEAPAAFFSLAPYGVAYGRQARSYALLLLLEIVLVTATARALAGHRRWLIVVAGSEALALWTHNVATTLVVGANLAWLLAGRRDARGWIAAQAAALLAWLPYLLRAGPQIHTHWTSNAWIVDYWRHRPLALAFLSSIGYMAAGSRVWPRPPTRHWVYAGAGSLALSLLCLASVLALLIAAFRRPTRKEGIFAASFTLGPLLALEAISLIHTPSYVLGRTDAVAYVGFILWCAVGLRSVGKPLRWGILAILVLSAALTLATNLPIGSRARGNDRAIGTMLRGQIRPGDWVAFVDLSRNSINYYASGGHPGRADPAIRRLDYPASFGKNPSATYGTPVESLRVWEREAYGLRDRFEKESSPGSRFYYVGGVKPSAPRDLIAEDLPYPGALLAYVLNGKRDLKAIARARGDGLGTDWIVFRVPRDSLIPLDQLQPVQAAP